MLFICTINLVIEISLHTQTFIYIIPEIGIISYYLAITCPKHSYTGSIGALSCGTSYQIEYETVNVLTNLKTCIEITYFLPINELIVTFQFNLLYFIYIPLIYSLYGSCLFCSLCKLYIMYIIIIFCKYRILVYFVCNVLSWLNLYLG